MSDEIFGRYDQTLAKPRPQAAPAGIAGVTLRDPASQSPVQPVLDSQELVERVGRLPLAEREAVTLFYFDRWPLDRVAATMERTPEQVAELLLAAAGALRGGSMSR